MSEACNAELVQILPLLRSTLPAAPDEPNPVPPFAAGTVKLPVKLPVTLRLPGIRTVSRLLPKTTVLLVETTAPEPMAVALFRLFDKTSASAPMIVLLFPVVLVSPAFTPKNELLNPPVVPEPALSPKN